MSNTERTVTQNTVQALLQLISDQKLESGSRLPPETQLIEELGASRSALREATSYLKGLGILESQRGSGFWVGHLDPVRSFDAVLSQMSSSEVMDMRELALLRLTLEIGAMDRAVRLATADDHATINRLVDEMDRISARPDCTIGEYDLLEADFHCAINRPAGIRMLNLLNRTIRDFFVRKNKTGEGNKPLIEQDRTNLEHHLIANAFVLRQPDTATLAMIHHLRVEERRLNAAAEEASAASR